MTYVAKVSGILSVLFQVYACMMVFFLSNMIENQCMSTGAFEITLNGEMRSFCSGVIVVHVYALICESCCEEERGVLL